MQYLTYLDMYIAIKDNYECGRAHHRLQIVLEDTRRSQPGLMRPTRPGGAATGLSCRQRRRVSGAAKHGIKFRVCVTCRRLQRLRPSVLCPGTVRLQWLKNEEPLLLLSSRLGTDVWMWLVGGEDLNKEALPRLGQSEERKSRRIWGVANRRRPRVGLVHALYRESSCCVLSESQGQWSHRNANKRF